MAAPAPYLAAIVSEVKSTIAVTINGEPHRIAAESTVAAMIAGLGLDPAKVAVERNLAIMPRSTFADVTVGEDDRFEIVHFVGGG